MGDKLTDGDLVERLRAVAKHGGNVSAAARAMGWNRGALSTQVNEAKARGLTDKTPIVSETDKLQSKLTQALAGERAIRQQLIEAEERFRAVQDLVAVQPEPPAWIVKRSASIKTAGVPMTIWSDWHFGEVVDAVQVAGVNTFNKIVGEARVRTLVEKTIALAKDHMVNAKYPGIVVCLGGDFITGEIHDELLATNWGTSQQQFIAVQDALVWALEQMAKVFGKVFCPCVPGNHGRNTHKPRKKDYAYTSFEWNLYHQLARHFRGDKRITFSIPDEVDAYFSVYGHRFFLTHGDTLGVKGGDGIIGAIGPIARGTTKVGRSEAQIDRGFDTLIMGHWHTYIPRGDAVAAIVNGSLIGYNEYARLGLRVPYSRPSQALWFVHPDHGITAQWQIYLDAKHTSADSSKWLTWEQRN